jgi:hypothetical protein
MYVRVFGKRHAQREIIGAGQRLKQKREDECCGAVLKAHMFVPIAVDRDATVSGSSRIGSETTC